MTLGNRITVQDAANLPCEVGDKGEIVAIRHEARDFPIGVRLDGSTSVEWFRECKLQVWPADAWMNDICSEQEAA